MRKREGGKTFKYKFLFGWKTRFLTAFHLVFRYLLNRLAALGDVATITQVGARISPRVKKEVVPAPNILIFEQYSNKFKVRIILFGAYWNNLQLRIILFKVFIRIAYNNFIRSLYWNNLRTKIFLIFWTFLELF